jgi:hypothetical protein
MRRNIKRALEGNTTRVMLRKMMRFVTWIKPGSVHIRAFMPDGFAMHTCVAVHLDRASQHSAFFTPSSSHP